MAAGRLISFCCVKCGLVHGPFQGQVMVHDVNNPKCSDMGHTEDLSCELRCLKDAPAKLEDPLHSDRLAQYLLAYDDRAFEIVSARLAPTAGAQNRIIVHYLDIEQNELTFVIDEETL